MPNEFSEHDFSLEEDKTKEFYKLMKNIRDYEIPLDKKPTHTRISGGKWYIEDKYNECFYKMIHEYIFEHDCELDLVEVHKQISPLLIDLDIRYKLNQKRTFNLDTIVNIVKYYINSIYQSFDNIQDLLNENPNLLDFHILIKDDVVNDIKNNKTKDGIHIIMPHFITQPQYQRWIRRDLITNHSTKLNELFTSIGNIEKLVDTIDKSVIFETGWQLYGCKKPNNYAYKLKYIISIQKNLDIKHKKIDDIIINNNNFNLVLKNTKKYKNLDLIKLYSIRNKDNETKLISKKNNQAMTEYFNSKNELQNQEKNKNSLDNTLQTTKSVKNKIQDRKIFGLPGQPHHLDYIHEIASKCLSQQRSDNYNKWYEVGQLLHNIDYTLLKTWIEFSKKSLKYEEGICERYWNTMKSIKKDKKNDSKNELTFGSLIYWAQTDNMLEYQNIYNKTNKSLDNNSPLYKLIEASRSTTDSDIANVILRYYNGLGNSEEIKYVCYNTKSGFYAEYNNNLHKWLCDDDTNAGDCLRKTFDTEILNLYNRDYKSLIAKKIACATEEGDNDEIEKLEKKKKDIDKISNRLKQVSSKSAILKECNSKFLQNKIVDKFDTSLDLIGFTNGVYDLTNEIFRDGRSSDYITLSTNIEYEDFHMEHQDIKDLMNIIKKILPIDRVLDWFLQILSTSLSGTQYFEHFYILSGSGANGKSILIDFIRDCFGEYYAQMNVSALCSKRPASSAADPELANLQGRRIVTFSEPSRDENINTGYLKYLTGGDKIQTRALYKGPVTFYPQGKLYLICNDIPNLHTDDDGTWRRVKVILFPSKFVCEHEMTGAKYEQKKTDPATLKEQLHQLRPAFIWLLIQYFKKFKQNLKNGGIPEPPEVNIATARQKAKNNPIETFIQNQIIFTNNKHDEIGITELTEKLREYMQNEGHHQKLIPKREEIKDKFNKLYPKLIRLNIGKTIDLEYNCATWSYIKFNDSEKKNKKNTSIDTDSDSE